MMTKEQQRICKRLNRRVRMIEKAHRKTALSRLWFRVRSIVDFLGGEE